MELFSRGADADTWKSRRKSRDKSTYGRVKVHSQRSSKGEERKPSVAGESGNALAGMWSDSPYSAPESDKTADDGERMAVEPRYKHMSFLTTSLEI